MLDSHFRTPYQKICIDPFLKIGKFISPTTITLLGLLFGLIASVLIATNHSYLACALLMLSGYLDTLDGSIARHYKKKSDLGCVLDIMSDRTVEAAVLIGLYLYAPIARGALCLAMLASILLCITSFLVVGMFSENHSEKNFHYSPGIIERSEAFFFFIAMILLPQHFFLLATSFTSLVFLTTATRLYQFAKMKSA